MTRELSILRYGLIIVPSFITSYVLEYVDYGMFTLHFLLLLLLVSLGLKLPRSYSTFWGCLEMLYTAWLCYEYGSLMLFPAVSALLFYSQLGPRYIPALLTCIHLIIINVAFMGATPLLLAYINITFLLAAILTAQLNQAARGREETLFLYDELRKRHF